MASLWQVYGRCMAGLWRAYDQIESPDPVERQSGEWGDAGGAGAPSVAGRDARTAIRPCPLGITKTAKRPHSAPSINIASGFFSAVCPRPLRRDDENKAEMERERHRYGSTATTGDAHDRPRPCRCSADPEAQQGRLGAHFNEPSARRSSCCQCYGSAIGKSVVAAMAFFSCGSLGLMGL